MGNVSLTNLPRRILTQSGPPPNAINQTVGKRYKGRGNPNGTILAYQGDSYIDLDSGIEWNKLTDNDGRPSVTGWEAESDAETDDVLNLAVRRSTLTTIYATDPQYGAVANFSAT